MSRKSLYLALATFTLAALVSACSKNSPMGPSDDATADRHRPVPYPEPACREALAEAPDTLWASVNAPDRISLAFLDLCRNEEGFVINYSKIDHRPQSPGFGPVQQMYVAASDQAASGEAWVTPVITGLDSGFHYKVWVEAYNCAGKSQAVFAIGNTLYREAAEEEDDQLAPPQAPDNLFASFNGTDMISIIFRDLSDNEAGFVVKVAILDGRPSSPGIRLVKTVSLPANAVTGRLVTGEIMGLESGFTYRVWVEATNAAGSSRSNLAFGETDLVEEEDDDRLVTSREGNVYQATPAGS